MKWGNNDPENFTKKEPCLSKTRLLKLLHAACIGFICTHDNVVVLTHNYILASIMQTF